MRKITIVFCLVFYTSSVKAQRDIDVLHYKFEIELNDKNDTISGRAEIEVKAVQDVEAFTFDIDYEKEKNKGMRIEKTFLFSDEKKEWLKIGFVQDSDGFAMIGFDKKLYRRTIFKIAIVYKGVPADGLIISKNKYGNRTFFADNWPNRAHNWIPCVDDPADKATVEFIVTAPSHYQIISNGLLIEETNLPGNKKLTHWKEDVPLPTKVMVIGAADFAVQRVGELNCIPVYSWVYPENKKEGFYDYAEAEDILSFFINYIGPYPYKKLANVQSKTRFGGMENASAIFYFENSVNGHREQETLLAHEIVHQWFGNMATEKSFAHLWLSEGFATYLTHIYVESKYGADSLIKRMKNEREEIIDFVKISHKPVVDSVSPLMQLLNTNSYQKGGWVLHMLRQQLGDSVFHKGIRQYYATYAGKNADTKDLQKVFEQVAGKNLNQFFKQWLYFPENPTLDLTWKYDAIKKEVRLHLKQQQTNIFQFPLTISLISKTGAATNNKIIVDKKESDHIFSTSGKPAYLVADPFTTLLFEAVIKEIK